MKKQLLLEQQKSKEEGLMALQNANEDKRRTVNEFQMRIQDLTSQLQRLEAKNQEEILAQKLQSEKEHLVNSPSSLIQTNALPRRTKSTI